MPGIADLVRSHQSAILERWRIEAQRTASARGLSHPEFMNIMPFYVASLADFDETRPEATREALDQLVGDHLASRLRQGFDLHEILSEFSILKRELGAVMASPGPSGGVASDERDRLFRELDRTMKLAAELFAQHMQEDEQTEKRYLRLLEAISNEALARNVEGPDFRRRLAEVLELIMEATGTHTAAILLFEPGSRELSAVVSAGQANGGLEQYAVSIGPDSFVNQVATGHRETTALLDVATTPLQISESLRRSGIHSLLGVRLCSHSALLGVLYVGLLEQRPFSIRETRRLEAFAERLALNLENARLYAELRAKIDELSAERDLRSRFVAILAHDLGGALQAAMSNAQLIIRQPESEPVVRRATACLRNLNRIARMRSDLLDVERIRAGSPLPLTLERVDLGELAREVADDLTELHPDRVVVCAEEGIVGTWSRDLLRRALWNLGSNGLKYGDPATSIQITVRRGKTGAEASIHNEGPPIPDAERERIFEPFAQVRTNDLSNGVHGWGLGLALVKACAEAHGGAIRLESAAGRGTTFILELPWELSAPSY